MNPKEYLQEFLFYLKEYLKEIFKDADYYKRKSEQFDFDDCIEEYKITHRTFGYSDSEYDNRHNSSSGMFMVFFPHIAGAVTGCAFARMFELGFWGYIILGIIFAPAIGTLKSMVFDDIPLKHALFKNLVIMGLYVSAAVLVFVVWKIMYAVV